MAVTAFPIVLIDSATGSDTQASGAGPSTALFGTTDASTDGAGTTVTLTAGTDLSGVATDGSHVIYLANATVGARNFAAINAKAGSGGATPTVTVEQAFAINLTTKSWAIGGRRATIGGANSVKLLNNNSAAGDAMPGWVVEMQSGHTESVSTTTIQMYRAGDTTNGPIIFRGKAGAATLPKITATGAINVIVLRAAYQIVRNMEITAGAATVTTAILQASALYGQVDGVKLSRTSTNVFTTGIGMGLNWMVTNCEIQRCTTGISAADAATIQNNWIHDCTGNGISFGAAGPSLGGHVFGNLIYSCGGDGINSAFDGGSSRSLTIIQNTIDSCTSDGIEISGATDSFSALRIVNNILSNNGAYGLNFSNASATDKFLAAEHPLIVGNQTYLNTTRAYKSATAAYDYNTVPWASGDNNLDPQYTAIPTGNATLGTNLKAAGFPVGGTLPVGTTSSTYSYVEPGCSQRQEPAAGPLVSEAKIVRGQQSY